MGHKIEAAPKPAGRFRAAGEWKDARHEDDLWSRPCPTPMPAEVAVRWGANEGVQSHGGFFSDSIKDYPAEKFYRECKLCLKIGEGTSEIQRLVIVASIKLKELKTGLPRNRVAPKPCA